MDDAAVVGDRGHYNDDGTTNAARRQDQHQQRWFEGTSSRALREPTPHRRKPRENNHGQTHHDRTRTHAPAQRAWLRLWAHMLVPRASLDRHVQALKDLERESLNNSSVALNNSMGDRGSMHGDTHTHARGSPSTHTPPSVPPLPSLPPHPPQPPLTHAIRRQDITAGDRCAGVGIEA
jgi:hypothetical protein